ncbi:hypothetical protein DRH27_04665 [Candidatus Falkowbacteria bacterium]|nr:MAG: hypothetical protein DRH27_04665 [Candidatus Falkowbacteria bacterium]
MAKAKKKTTKKKKVAKKKKPKSKPKAKAKTAKTKKKSKTQKVKIVKRNKSGLFAEGTNAGGNESTLTPAIAMQLAKFWRHNISDKTACSVIGITEKQLKGWLERDTEVRIVINTGTTIKEQIIGLRVLRTRERGFLEFDFLERHDQAVKDASTALQFGHAIKGLEFMLERRFPNKYGKNSTDVDEGKPKAVKFPLAPPPPKKKKSKTVSAKKTQN